MKIREKKLRYENMMFWEMKGEEIERKDEEKNKIKDKQYF